MADDDVLCSASFQRLKRSLYYDLVDDDDDVYDACNDDEVIASCRGASYAGILGRGVTRKVLFGQAGRQAGKQARKKPNDHTNNCFLPFFFYIFYPFSETI